MSTHKIPFLNIKKKIILNYPKSATMEFVPRDPRNEFEPAVVNEQSVFEPLKFYCISLELEEWMDDLRFFVLFNSISVISGLGVGNNERLYAMEPGL